MALHICAQDALPITLVAAGLPQIAAKMGKAKTYAERLTVPLFDVFMKRILKEYKC